MISRTFLASLLVLAAALAHAQVPRTIDYQGYLTTTGGVPVNASLLMSFALYEEPAGGTALWTETQTVPVNNGMYHVALGSVTPLSLSFDRQYYLGVTVGADAEMLPRHPLSSAPYALRAGCNPGDMVTCYQGAEGTLNVGACKAGVRVCNATGTAYGPCTGQVAPAAEICGNGIDDNCDGQENDGCGSPTCTTGVPATCGIGACFRSIACTSGYEVCTPGAPVAEACNGVDDNCDGIVDVDAFPTLGQVCLAQDPAIGVCIWGQHVCSANQLGVECSTGSTPCIEEAPSVVSAQIATARASPDGLVNLRIDGAFVTYVKPALGAEPAGFFVQAETTGPALFVAVPPDSLLPMPVQTDKVNFTIDAMGTSGGQRRATAISGLYKVSRSNQIEGLAQDVSNASDLVSNLSDYESELISVAGTISSSFSASGVGYSAAMFGTAGVTDSGLQLRLPATLPVSLDLAVGCTATLQRVPLWRFGGVAQVSAWSAPELQSLACPAPRVVGAVAFSATSVRITFDRLIDPGSVSPTGNQFVDAAGALAVSEATVSGKTVTLTTSTQVEGSPYTIVVSPFVTDTHGTGVDATVNSAMFAGFAAPTGLVINEVDYDQPGIDTAEFVEIHNPTGEAIPLTDLALIFVNGTNSLEYARVGLSAAGSELAAGGYLVVASSSVSTAPGALVVLFAGADNQIQNGPPDGIALFNTASNTLIDALSYGGQIVAAQIVGAPGTYNLVEGVATSALDSNSSPGSLARLPNGLDTGDASTDWGFTSTPTPGAANAP